MMDLCAPAGASIDAAAAAATYAVGAAANDGAAANPAALLTAIEASVSAKRPDPPVRKHLFVAETDAYSADSAAAALAAETAATTAPNPMP